MAKVDLKIKSTTPTAQSQTTTISYVNPELTNTQLKTLGQTLNALTDNVYDESQKVTTVNVDAEADKTTPTLYLRDSTQPETISTTYSQSFAIRYNGTGKAYHCIEPATVGAHDVQVTIGGNIVRALRFDSSCEVFLYAPETETENKVSKRYYIDIQ